MKTSERKFTRRYHQLMEEFPLYPIKTKRQADEATRILDDLFREKHSDPGEEAYVVLLAGLLADYEEEHEEANKLAGLHALQFLMEERGVKPAELADLLGVGRSAISQIVNGQKPITAEHARRLGKRFKLNPGTFL